MRSLAEIPKQFRDPRDDTAQSRDSCLPITVSRSHARRDRHDVLVTTLEVAHTFVRRDSRQVWVKRRCCCKRQRESQTTFCIRSRTRARVPTFNAVLAGLTVRMNLRDYTDEPVNYGQAHGSLHFS